MKSFEIEGYVINFEYPDKCKKNNEIIIKDDKSSDVKYLNDVQDNVTNDKAEIKHRLKEWYLYRFFMAYVSKELIEKEHLKKNDIIKVKEPILYNENGNKTHYNEPVDLLLLDDETGECLVVDYVNKLKHINEMKDDKIRRYEYEKISVDQRSVIEYKDGDKIVTGVVLADGLDFYKLMDSEDYFGLLLGRKECKDVPQKLIDKNSFVRLLHKLDRTFIKFNLFIGYHSEIINKIKKK